MQDHSKAITILGIETRCDEIAGEEFPQTVCIDFTPAEQIPTQFSLLRVLKSIRWQMILLAKSLKNHKLP